MKRLFYIFFLLLMPVALQATISSGLGRGEGQLGIASKKFYFADRNPANIYFIQGGLLGSYYATGLKDLTFDNLEDTQRAAFAAARWQNLAILAEAYSDGQRVDGGSVGGAFSFSENWQIGLMGSLRSSEQIYEGGLGSIYSFDMNHSFMGPFGLYDLNLGAAYNISGDQKTRTEHSGLAGVNVKFFKMPWLTLSYDNSFAMAKNLSDLVFVNSFSLLLFNILEISGGYSGSEFFAYDKPFMGVSLGYASKHLSFRTFASTAPEKLAQSGDISNDFSTGAYISFDFWSHKETLTDKKLTWFFEPNKTITPNNDRDNDFLVLHLSHSDFSRIKDYNLVVYSKQGKVVNVIQPDVLQKSARGNFRFPAKIFWYALDFKGQQVPDGDYNLKLILFDQNLRKFKWPLGTVTVDSTEPDFNVFIEQKNYRLTSEPALRIKMRNKSRDIKHYFIRVLDQDNRVFYKQKIHSKAIDSEFKWLGYIRGKAIIDSGNYNIEVLAFDKNNNKKRKLIKGVHLYRPEDKAVMQIPYISFSPNNDQKADVLPIGLTFLGDEPIQSWQVQVISLTEKKPIYTFRGGNLLPQEVTWPGTNQKGKKLPDGLFQLTFEVIAGGQIYQGLTYRVQIDTKAPQIIATGSKSFTPDGDGKNDFFDIRLRSIEDSKILAHEITIVDNKGRLLQKFSAKKPLPKLFKWNGQLASGISVDSFEKFKIRVKALDAAGNLGQSNAISGETGIMINRQANDISLGASYVTLRFPNIRFARGKSRPTPTSMTYLKRLAEFLKTKPGTQIEIVGHTDNRGGRLYNKKLAKKRAGFFYKFLSQEGLAKDKMVIRAVGQDQPLYPNVSDEFRARNRRVELILKKP